VPVVFPRRQNFRRERETDRSRKTNREREREKQKDRERERERGSSDAIPSFFIFSLSLSLSLSLPPFGETHVMARIRSLIRHIPSLNPFTHSLVMRIERGRVIKLLNPLD